jgi:predicted nucleotidyltransferase
MPDESPKARLERIAEIFVRHGVRFIVIGGQAEYIFGSPRVTYDVDLCYERAAENLARLATALRELKPTLRGVSEDVPFILDARSLALGSNFTFNTELGPLDLLGYVEPIGDYKNVSQRASTWDVAGLKLSVIDLDDLIRIKQHVGRSKDRESLLQLLAIKKLRDEEQSR